LKSDRERATVDVAWLGLPRATVVKTSDFGVGPVAETEAAGARLAGTVPGNQSPDALARELHVQAPDLIVATWVTTNLLEALSLWRPPLPTGRRVAVIMREQPGPDLNLPQDRYSFRFFNATTPDAKDRLLDEIRQAVREYLRDFAPSRERMPDVVPWTDAALASLRLLQASLPSPRAEGSDSDPGTVALAVADLGRVACYFGGSGGWSGGQVSLVGDGALDFMRPVTRAGLKPVAWGTLCERLPFELDTVELSNIIGRLLTGSPSPPGSLGEACIRAALLEELLQRVRASETCPGPVQSDRPALIVGTGHEVARLADVGLVAHTLINGLGPRAVTAIAVDPTGSVLREAADPSGDGLRRLPELVAVTVAPFQAHYDWSHPTTNPLAIVTVERAGKVSLSRTLVAGTLSTVRVPPDTTARLVVEPCSSELDFGAGPGRTWHGTVPGSKVGLVLDGRGRPIALPADTGLRISRRIESLVALGVREPADTRTHAATETARAEVRATRRPEIDRTLPPGAELLVGPGDMVKADTPIARGRYVREVLRLPALAGDMKLLKRPEDRVKAGETVAVMEGLLGLQTVEAFSPFSGVVEAVEGARLTLVDESDRVEAMVEGTVISATTREVAIAPRGVVIEACFGVGHGVRGVLRPVGELLSEADLRRLAHLELAGCVALAESYVTSQALALLVRAGAVGLICGGIDLGLLWDKLTPGGPFPDGRGLPTLVALEGFGVYRISPRHRSALRAAEGLSVYITGAPVRELFSASRPARVVLPSC